jgi:3-phosphoshikimate 1-carboxyvinyltransferase
LSAKIVVCILNTVFLLKMIVKLHKPNLPIKGLVSLPGSKSLSNRVLMIQALSGLSFTISNLSNADDTKHLQAALKHIKEGTSQTIDIGHAGTDMRFLTSYLSIQNGTWHLTGSERMQQRPIADLVDVLKQLGASISYENQEGYPPLLIKGTSIRGGSATINGNVSSQYISSLLLVAPYFIDGLELTLQHNLVSLPYITMTIEVMKEFGADIKWNGNTITVKPTPYFYNQPNYVIESDWSAASYFYSLVALSDTNTTLTLNSLFKKSLQADAVCATIYKQFGVETLFENNQITITKQAKSISEFNFDFINCPDIAQTLVASCIGLNIPFHFTGLQTLKVKETDRIIALKHEAHKIGFDLAISNDSITYQLPSTIKQDITEAIATYSDHRMAMAFAPLCLIYDTVLIEDADVVSKSYPTFWDDLKSIGINIENL